MVFCNPLIRLRSRFRDMVGYMVGTRFAKSLTNKGSRWGHGGGGTVSLYNRGRPLSTAASLKGKRAGRQRATDAVAGRQCFIASDHCDPTTSFANLSEADTLSALQVLDTPNSVDVVGQLGTRPTVRPTNLLQRSRIGLHKSRPFHAERPLPNTARPISPYSRPAVLAKLDQRTKEARLVREMRAELIAHVGGAPSATQRALIDQAVSLKLHIALMDRRAAENGGAMGEAAGRQYLAWANAFSRLLRQLGTKAAAQRPRSLAEHLADRSTP
jgi:hypothetical protein